MTRTTRTDDPHGPHNHLACDMSSCPGLCTSQLVLEGPYMKKKNSQGTPGGTPELKENEEDVRTEVCCALFFQSHSQRTPGSHLWVESYLGP
jgi:hypothetical protein